MPRVVKHPEARRAEILDHAMARFLERGYDNVSLNDLISAAGVSKGAFYHWFDSKDALIEGLAARSAQQAVGGVEAALARCDGDALDRLNTLLQAGFDLKVQTGTPARLAAMASLLRPENAHLYGLIVARGQELFQPLFTRVIAEGAAEGVFDTFDPEGVGDMIQSLAASTSGSVLAVLEAADESERALAVDVLTTRFRLHALAVDRVLGLSDGSVHALTREQVEALVAPAQ